MLLMASSVWSIEVRRAKIFRAIEGVRLDGDLNDEAWQKAEPIGSFVQADPYPGKPPSEPTEVRLAYDDDALYIAVQCFDSDPGKIFTSTMARDARPFDDDNIEIVLDTFGDRRNGYYLLINAAGSMTDGRVVENVVPDVSWDGIWDARTRIDEKGWTAEIRIPFKTLAFKPGVTEWGFNIERTIGRLNEESRWEGFTMDASVHAVARAGIIEGFEGLTQGIGLDVKPYGLLGVNRELERPGQVRALRDGGADIFYRLTSNLLSSTTFNTDFAETEVDTRQVNLTRFPLFFPEKRAFFLEDAGVFQFGLPAAGTTMLPFFSRRIGLVGGEAAPIAFGEKLTGKAGRFEVGLLDVMTRDSEVAPGQNFFVGRAKMGFWRQSYLGAIFTHGEPTGQTDNSLAGADLVLATSNFLGRGKNFDFAMYGVKTNTPGIVSRDMSYGVQARYPNDRINIGYSWQEIGENFDPQLGYVQRKGVRINSLNGRLGTRPKQNRYVRQFAFGAEFENYENRLHRSVETRNYEVTPLEILFHGTQRLVYSIDHNFERLFEPFAIRENIVIPVGSYSFYEHEISYNGPTNKPVSYSVSFQKGPFYSGSSDELVSSLNWRKSARMTAGFEFRQYWVRLKEGRFNTSLALMRFNNYFNPRVSLTNFIQYDTDSQNIGLQSRLRWIITPGNEVYVVFNHQWQEDALDRFQALRTDLRAKLNYTFRF